MLHSKITCDTYGAHIIVYSDADSKQVSRSVFRRYGCIVDCSREDAGAMFVLEACKEGNPTQYLLWVRESDDIAVLAHECVHLAIRILHDRGVVVTVDNDEPLAYYHNYLFRILWNEMLIYTEKKNQKRRK